MLTNRGKASDIGNRIVFSGNEWTSGEALVENVKLPLRLHCESVDRVLQLDRPIVIEMRKPTTQIWSAANLPEKPRHAFHAPYNIKGNEAAELSAK
jgi:hypothetical protein